MLVTAVSTAAFAQALKMGRRKGTGRLVGVQPGEFPTPIFDVTSVSVANLIQEHKTALAMDHAPELAAIAGKGEVR